MDAQLTDNEDPNYEILAYFLADVDTESTAGEDGDAGKLEILDASGILTYYARIGASMEANWEEIIPALVEKVGSLWYDRANR
jgi:hypothetical protein